MAEPGFEQFLKDVTLNRPIYYHRELDNVRDPPKLSSNCIFSCPEIEISNKIFFTLFSF